MYKSELMKAKITKKLKRADIHITKKTMHAKKQQITQHKIILKSH